MINQSIDFERYRNNLSSVILVRYMGKVVRVAGLVIEANGPSVPMGDLCFIHLSDGYAPIPAEVVGFKEERILLMPIGELDRIRPGARVTASGLPMRIKVGTRLLGRIIGGLGEAIDGKGSIDSAEYRSIYNSPPDPLTRNRIKEPLKTGVRVLDGLCTCGKGQRMGIFAGSGVGKSTLLGMIARNSEADVNVIALIGERGREVREFVEKNLGFEGLKKICSSLCYVR